MSLYISVSKPVMSIEGVKHKAERICCAVCSRCFVAFTVFTALNEIKQNLSKKKPDFMTCCDI